MIYHLVNAGYSFQLGDAGSKKKTASRLACGETEMSFVNRIKTKPSTYAHRFLIYRGFCLWQEAHAEA